ncbi:SMI1/KNR4 family protein [Amycolatopsis alba DSM 44262]|uniref:SMI1/KNR4 family protein n=1 Tax=Amycolatopsis alba DSM 44262 TaxID=1125972 RepID=A0A229REA3_AMYAL|nr:SMI1/KNR4 family protein [Amycolatopsis alba DSM 44262]
MDWDAVERALGSTLPQDYREFCSLYPAIVADNFIRIDHPSCSNERLNLLKDGLERTEQLGELVDEFSHHHAFGAFPSLGGLLCWGSSTSSEQLYWLTVGPADDWKIVVGDLEDDHLVFDGGFAAFLTELFSGRLNTPVLGDYVAPLSKVRFFK